MIRYKGQASQAKHERYPAIIIFFLVSLTKALKTANLKENVPAPKPNVLIDEDAKRICFVCNLAFTGRSQFFKFCP